MTPASRGGSLAPFVKTFCSEAPPLHAHNYQRFSRELHGRRIPYLVAGSGGFHERHGVGSGLTDLPAAFPGLPGVRLESFQCTEHGFMTVSARRTAAEVVYSTVSDGVARHFDSFRIAPGRLI